jgi:hypothetical protein
MNIAYAQWTTPRMMDPSLKGVSDVNIAIGPHREIAIGIIHSDTISCYTSLDNGRTFHQALVDTVWDNLPFFLQEPDLVDGIAFDSHSNIYILYGMMFCYDIPCGHSYRISRSTDAGQTFSKFWRVDEMDNMAMHALQKSALRIDKNNFIHTLTEWLYPPSRYYDYTRLSTVDIMDEREIGIAEFPNWYDDVSVDLFVQSETVHVALTMKSQSTGLSSLYHYLSTDTGKTFNQGTCLDTMNARRPQFVLTDDRILRLVYVSGARATQDIDSLLIARTFLDTGFSAPYQLMDHFNAADSSPNKWFSVQPNGSNISVAYPSFRTGAGVSYLEWNISDGVKIDSLFLAGHTSPHLAVDSLGGIYLVTVCNGQAYLSTKDVVLGVEEKYYHLPTSYLLSQNYPNPFNPSTQITFTIPKQSRVRLVIYDILGREVATLLNENKPPGIYTVQWITSNIPSGVYFCQFSATDAVEIRKLILTK